MPVYKGYFLGAIFVAILDTIFCRAIRSPLQIACAKSMRFEHELSRDVAEVSNMFDLIFGKLQQIATNIAPESHRNRR